MKRNIVVVGSAHLDFIISLPALPKIGETVTGGVFSRAYGGKGSNQMVAAQRAGGSVAAVASLGGDAYGREYRQLYEREGIDITHVELHENKPCGIAFIQVDGAGNNTLSIATGANALLSAEQVENAKALFSEASLLMVQMEIPDQPILEAIRLARENGMMVMMNYAPVRETAITLSDEIDILVVNEPEASSLIGSGVSTREDAGAAARRLAENGHRLVVVTLGADGCVAWENGSATHYPAAAVKAVDATAAGDSFCGALAAALVEGRRTADAIRFASAAGALCVQKAGAMPSIPYRSDIERFYNGLDRKNPSA